MSPLRCEDGVMALLRVHASSPGVKGWSDRRLALVLGLVVLLAVSGFAAVFLLLRWGGVPGGGEGGEGEGYLGMSLPANFTVFAEDSPWNTPIPNGAEVDPNSDLIIANLKDTLQQLGYDPPHIGVNYKIWTSPLHVIDSSRCPLQDVPTTNPEGALYWTVDPDGNGVAEGIPIPAGVWQDPSDDGHMILVDPKLRVAWEFSCAVQVDGQWMASSIDRWDLNGLGYRPPYVGPRWWRCGVRGSGVPYIGGLLRVEELESGEIRHALALSSPINRRLITTPSADWEQECCSPAARTDGTGIGPEYIPEGARIQLNPDLDLDSRGLSEDAKVVARALQVYGAYVVDSGGGFSLYLQNLGPDGGAWTEHQGLADIAKIPLDELRVLKTEPTVKEGPTTETAVAFDQLPSSVEAGANFTVTVKIVDQHGQLVDTSNRSVMLALANNPGAATLKGTLIAAAQNGIATFTIQLDQPGTGYTLYAMAPDLDYAESPSFTVTSPQAQAKQIPQRRDTHSPTEELAITAIRPALLVTLHPSSPRPKGAPVTSPK